MRALFQDAPLIQHYDMIGLRESGQAVRIGAIYCRTRKGWVMAR